MRRRKKRRREENFKRERAAKKEERKRKKKTLCTNSSHLGSRTCCYNSCVSFAEDLTVDAYPIQSKTPNHYGSHRALQDFPTVTPPPRPSHCSSLFHSSSATPASWNTPSKILPQSIWVSYYLSPERSLPAPALQQGFLIHFLQVFAQKSPNYKGCYNYNHCLRK